MYDLIANIVDKQFSSASFKSNFFEKNDLISDMYLYLSEIGKELTEKEITDLLKRKYFSYFDVYDIKDTQSYDKFETGVGVVSNLITPAAVDKNETAIYEFFENIIWKSDKACPKCKSKEVYPSQKNTRYHECRSCGYSFSFSQKTNLRYATPTALKNILTVYKLFLKGTICFREIQEKTKLSKTEIKSAYQKVIPNIINDEDLIKPVQILPVKFKKPKKFKEYKHQTETIRAAVTYFKDNNRGKIIHPCGSGKTYTAIKIAQKIKPKRLLVVIPSRALLKQQIDSFVPYFEEHTFYAFGSLNNYEKEFRKNKVVVLAPTVTEQKRLIKKVDENQNIVVFTTLTSFAEMREIFTDDYFDFAIFDEAHRVAGEDYKAYLKTLYFQCYKKALFLTATEKNYNEDSAVGMNNEIFGETISKIYMKEMIDAGVICDYNIINIGFTDEDITKTLEENEEFFLDVKVKLPVKTRILMSALCLVKCIEKYPIKKVITYHSTIEESILFINIFKLFQQKYGLSHSCYNLHSGMSGYNFNENLLNFINSEKAVISSVNCFQEGIDVVDVDAVLYGYPKKSKIDIPQSVGRCIRKAEGKEMGYVIIPDEIGNTKTFGKLLRVLNALESVDNRIEEFKAIGKKSTFSKNVVFDFLDTSANISFNVGEYYTKLEVSMKGSGFVTYEECQKFCRDNNIDSLTKWKKIDKPINIPKHPISLYNVKWTELFETTYWSYDECREWFIFNKHLDITSGTKMKKCPIVPKNIPKATKALRNNFGDEWGGWDHFLGLSNSKETYTEILSYEKAKEYIALLKKDKLLTINNRKEYDMWSKCESFPKCLPKNPYAYYPNFSMIDFLGKKDTRHDKKRQFYDFETATKIVQQHEFKSIGEFRQWLKNSNETMIPTNPNKIYINNWISWENFLRNEEKIFNYAEAKQWIYDNNVAQYFIQYKDWEKFKKNQLPIKFNSRLSLSPKETYAKDWISWEDFLGKIRSKYISYACCKHWAISEKVSSKKEYIEKRKFYNKENLPSDPEKYYKEWTDWHNFLNKKPERNKLKFLPYTLAKDMVELNNISTKNEYKKLVKDMRDYPLCPDVYYRKEWKGWDDFLNRK